MVRVPKAYPYYDFSYKANVETIRKWIEAEAPNIHPVGRNGMHKYNNQDHSMYTAMLTVENMFGAAHDIWSVNVEEEYHEAGSTGRDAPVLPRRTRRHGEHARPWLSTRPAGAAVAARWMTLADGRVGVSRSRLRACGCTPGPRARRRTRCAGAGTPRCSCGSSSGRPLRWPTGTTRSTRPPSSTPRGINLLAQTSVTGLSLPLVPGDLDLGPGGVAQRRLHDHAGAHRVHRFRGDPPLGPLDAGRLRRAACSTASRPSCLTSLEFAHLMTAALMLLPLILVVLDEIFFRQRHGAVWAGVLLGLLVFAQFFLSSELLAVTAVVHRVVGSWSWWSPRCS